MVSLMLKEGLLLVFSLLLALSLQNSTAGGEPTFNAASNVWIKNGRLGRSSHHGIHGNSNSRVLIENLKIDDYRAAAIQLNGAEDAVIRNVDAVDCRKTPVRLSSRYSQALFVLRTLELVRTIGGKTVEDVTIPMNNRETGAIDNMNIGDVIMEIDRNLQPCLQAALSGSAPPADVPDADFLMQSVECYDGAMYGFLFNTAGVAINGFKTERTNEDKGNKNIIVQDCKLGAITACPKESLQIKETKNSDDGKPTAVHGAFGGSVDAMDITNGGQGGKAKRNCLCMFFFLGGGGAHGNYSHAHTPH